MLGEKLMGKERISLYDNTKGILIILTVIGHLLSQYMGQYASMDSAYIFIYLFHMPAFCLMSGFFSKNAEKGRANCFKSLIIPYILVYVLWLAYYNICWDKGVEFDLMRPGYAQWYLLSLITWRLVLPTFLRLRYPLICSIIIALVAGFFDDIGAEFSLSRTIVFFPFFLIGYYLTKEHFEKISSYKKIWGVLGLVLAAGVAIAYEQIGLPKSMLYAKASYNIAHCENWEGIIFRTALYGIAIFMTFCIINLTPKKKSILTQIGANSLMILVLHVYVIRYFTFSGAFLDLPYWQAVAFIIITATVLVLVFSREFINTGFNKLTGGIYTLIVKITRPLLKEKEKGK